jgi:hypothetical protein
VIIIPLDLSRQRYIEWKKERQAAFEEREECSEKGDSGGALGSRFLTIHMPGEKSTQSSCGLC